TAPHPVAPIPCGGRGTRRRRTGLRRGRGRRERGDEHRDERQSPERNQRDPSRFVPQVHVVGDNKARLDRRKDDKDGNRLEPRQAEAVDIQLDECHDGEDYEHDNVRALLNLLDRSRFRCRRGCHPSPPIRYTTMNRKIQTTSTKCQYSPTSSTAS